jgi:hypothetical protein
MTDIDRLIEQLIRADSRRRPDLWADILACGDVAVEPLVAIILDPEMYRRGRLPEYAVGLLGDLRSEAAIPALIEMLRWQGMRERLERVIGALVRIGPAVAEPLKSVALDRSLRWYPRSLALGGLAALVYAVPESTQEILEFLQALLVSGPVECPDDRIIYTMLAQDIADLQGMDGLEAIQVAFQRGAIDRDYLDWPDAETMCRNATPRFLRRYTVDFLPAEGG